MLGRFWSKSKNRQFWLNFSESKSWKNRSLNICQNRPKSKSNTVPIIKSKSNNFGIDPALINWKVKCPTFDILMTILSWWSSVVVDSRRICTYSKHRNDLKVTRKLGFVHNFPFFSCFHFQIHNWELLDSMLYIAEIVYCSAFKIDEKLFYAESIYWPNILY